MLLISANLQPFHILFLRGEERKNSANNRFVRFMPTGQTMRTFSNGCNLETLFKFAQEKMEGILIEKLRK